MTTQQPSLFHGEPPSTWQRQLERILDDAMRVVRTAAVNGRRATDADLEEGLRLIKQIADELRVLHSDDGVPF